MNDHVCQPPPIEGVEDDADWVCPVCERVWWFDANNCRPCLRSGPAEWRPEVVAQRLYDKAVGIT